MSTIEQSNAQLPNFTEFLESFPPGQRTMASNVARANQRHIIPPNFLRCPDIILHCSYKDCEGLRTFECRNNTGWELKPDVPLYVFLQYQCRNCHESFKTFSLVIVGPRQGIYDCKVMKFGEDPPFGPPVPTNVNKLIGPDRELFFKGYRAEKQSLGIGAFAYYRRVVENQKARLVDKLIEAASRVGARKEVLDQLELSKTDSQFSKAMDAIKDSMPQSLLVKGHNPLTLLYSPLSKGIHEYTDEECLEKAKAIRTVLFELADRITEALKDRRELETAITKLLDLRPEEH